MVYYYINIYFFRLYKLLSINTSHGVLDFMDENNIDAYNPGNLTHQCEAGYHVTFHW